MRIFYMHEDELRTVIATHYDEKHVDSSHLTLGWREPMQKMLCMLRVNDKLTVLHQPNLLEIINEYLRVKKIKVDEIQFRYTKKEGFFVELTK